MKGVTECSECGTVTIDHGVDIEAVLDSWSPDQPGLPLGEYARRQFAAALLYRAGALWLADGELEHGPNHDAIWELSVAAFMFARKATR